MKPDENKNPTEEPSPNIVTGAQESITPSATQPTVNSTTPTAVSAPTPNKSHKKTWVALVVVLVLVLAGGVAFALYQANHKSKPTVSPSVGNTSGKDKTTTKSSAKTTVATPIITDTWTGGGTTSNWSDSANWSNGVPKTGYNLVFNMSHSVASGAGQITANDDLTNVTINNISFTGGADRGVTSINITGNPIYLTGGINVSDEATGAQFRNPIYLEANQTFGGNAAYGGGGFVGNVYLSHYTLTLTDGSTLQSLSGNGKLIVDVPAGNDVTINTLSPSFTGSAQIESGQLGVDSRGDNSQLGTGTITINNGGTLRVNSLNSSTTFSNNIIMSGKGAGAEGAINIVAPLTDLTLTGSITLTGDTELGVYNNNNTDTGPGTFNLTRAPITNGYSLSGISSSIKVSTP